MAVITISRQFGAGGETLGRMISNELGYTFADNNIIQKVANEANVSPNFVKLVETEGGTKLSKFISKVVSQRWLDRALSNERGYIDEQLYIDYLILIIAQMADEGNAVILGRGSQYILKDHPDTFGVLLIDDMENRAKFLIKNYDISEKQAMQSVKNEDKRRANLYNKLGKEDYDDPALYHMVLNMSKFSIEDAFDLVCNVVKKM